MKLKETYFRTKWLNGIVCGCFCTKNQCTHNVYAYDSLKKNGWRIYMGKYIFFKKKYNKYTLLIVSGVQLLPRVCMQICRTTQTRSNWVLYFQWLIQMKLPSNDVNELIKLFELSQFRSKIEISYYYVIIRWFEHLSKSNGSVTLCLRSNRWDCAKTAIISVSFSV